MRRRGSFLAGFLAAGALAALAAFTGLGAATTSATPPTSASPPTITGSATDGSTFVASSGSWSGDTPITFSYQWSRCDSSGSSCANISGATSQTYGLGSADVGKTIRVFVTATNATGTAGALSAATSVVAAAAPTTTKPHPTSQPNVSGTTQVGQTLTAETGTWNGTTPISFSFAWQRCDVNGAHCNAVKDATKQTYVLTATDVGSRMRASVTAKNSAGTGAVDSNLSGTVTAVSTKPGLVAAPVLSGSFQVGGTLSTTAGSWTSPTTVHFTYAWLRCDTKGSNCAAIAGAASAAYKVTSADQGHTVRSQVTATNAAGAAASASAQTAVVAGAPAGPTGPRKTVLVTSLKPPERLVVSGVRFTPKRITSRSPFTVRYRVTDTHGDPVQGALVYSIALPHGIVAPAAETPTDPSGYATMVLRPTSKLSLGHGSIVLFVRARKPGDPLLSGISTRRLVQVLVR